VLTGTVTVNVSRSNSCRSSARACIWAARLLRFRKR